MSSAAPSTLCIDCPDLPNGVHKRPVCCRRAGQEREFKVGDVVPLPTPKLDVRPTAPIDNRPSYKPSRHPVRAPGK
jgi:hypothetical protein